MGDFVLSAASLDPRLTGQRRAPRPAAAPPVADAGADRSGAVRRSSFDLDGSGSRAAAGRSLEQYVWRRLPPDVTDPSATVPHRGDRPWPNSPSTPTSSPTTPTVEVTVSPNNPMPSAGQRFRLVVVDDSGNASAADEVTIIVADQDAPTAVLRAPRMVARPAAASTSTAARRSTSAAGASCSTSGPTSGREHVSLDRPPGRRRTRMATFVPGRPITHRASRAITVDAGLRAGRHRFQLEVIDGVRH